MMRSALYFIVAAALVLCPGGTLFGQHLEFKLFDKLSRDTLRADSIRIRIDNRGIDTVITKRVYSGWARVVSVEAQSAVSTNVRLIGTELVISGAPHSKLIEVAAYSVLGHQLASVNGISSAQGELRIPVSLPHNEVLALHFNTRDDAWLYTTLLCLTDGHPAQAQPVVASVEDSMYVTAFVTGYYPQTEVHVYRGEFMRTMELELADSNWVRFISAVRVQARCAYDSAWSSSGRGGSRIDERDTIIFTGPAPGWGSVQQSTLYYNWTLDYKNYQWGEARYTLSISDPEDITPHSIVSCNAENSSGGWKTGRWDLSMTGGYYGDGPVMSWVRAPDGKPVSLSLEYPNCSARSVSAAIDRFSETSTTRFQSRTTPSQLLVELWFAY